MQKKSLCHSANLIIMKSNFGAKKQKKQSLFIKNRDYKVTEIISLILQQKLFGSL